MDTWSNHTLTRNWASFLGSESPRIMHTKQDVPITNIGWDNYSNKSSTFYDFLPHMIFMQNMHQQITSAPWSRVTSSGAGHPWGHRYWRWLRPATRHEPGIGESIKRNVKVGEGDEHAKCAQLQRCIYLYIYIYYYPDTNGWTYDQISSLVSVFKLYSSLDFILSSIPRWSGCIFRSSAKRSENTINRYK